MHPLIARFLSLEDARETLRKEKAGEPLSPEEQLFATTAAAHPQQRAEVSGVPGRKLASDVQASLVLLAAHTAARAIAQEPPLAAATAKAREALTAEGASAEETEAFIASILLEEAFGYAEEVDLVDFAGRADGAFRLDGCLSAEQSCTGHMLQENDFAGYRYSSYEEAVETLASHEFFHAVQAAYRANLGSVVSEGTAVWATERFDPALPDLENFSSAYLDRPDRSLVLDPDGPGSFSYGGSLFFQFLSERFGDGVILSMWQASTDYPSARWPELLDRVLSRDQGSDFDRAFAEFAQWNMSTGSRFRPGQAYARGAGYSEINPAVESFPVDEPSVRVAPASTRYFELPGGTEDVSVSFQPTDEAESSELHLLVAAVVGKTVLRVARADGPGRLRAHVPASDATRVFVAVVDGRQQGVGQYGRLCIMDTFNDSPCEVPVPEPDEHDGCQSAPGAAAWPLAMLALSLWRRRRTARPRSGAP